MRKLTQATDKELISMADRHRLFFSEDDPEIGFCPDEFVRVLTANEFGMSLNSWLRHMDQMLADGLLFTSTGDDHDKTDRSK